ncbi:MAG: glycosyltransferase [Saprospiraceae bacterium]|nr:MAG: glycosyl transferase family 2 [Candidatus Parvibacillus calidus]MBK7741534.1 glycosyltransferase [Candidatus Parvibacillus calidus]MCC7149936.1 glycosyltransferase [Saprospiraceae bacterium]WKZ63608.1 MAG: glycosyltransferase [Saprospiraceae bacterium]
MVQESTFCVVTPVFNDWDCFERLYVELKAMFAEQGHRFMVLAVNDGSTLPFPEHFKVIQNIDIEDRVSWSDEGILVLDLQRNLGHQKAIAIGISFVERHIKPDYCIVMDSDGEDRPSDIPHLIKADHDGSKIIFARRRSRQESRMFKYMYRIYKIVFKLMSGYVISFGNFVLIPRKQLSRLVYISEIWNHFPGGIMRSKLPYISVPIDRGRRYKGRSKMGMVALVQHGISSITVNIDIVSVRLLLFSVGLMLITFLLFCSLIVVKFFTNFAIPGWTSLIAISLLMIMLQSFFFSLLLTFVVLNARVQKNFIPAIHHMDYVRSLKQYTF